MLCWVPGSSQLPFAAGGPCRCGLFWAEHFCVHSRSQDPAGDAGIFLPTISLERHLKIWPVLIPVEGDGFWHQSQWAAQSIFQGASPTHVIKCVSKLLSQYFISHSFNRVCTFQTYKINIDFLCQMESNKLGLHTFIIRKWHNTQESEACVFVRCTDNPRMKIPSAGIRKRLCTTVFIHIRVHVRTWSKMWPAHKNVENDKARETIYKTIIFSIYNIQLHLCWIRVWLLRMNFQNMLFPFLVL